MLRLSSKVSGLICPDPNIKAESKNEKATRKEQKKAQRAASKLKRSIPFGWRVNSGPHYYPSLGSADDSRDAHPGHNQSESTASDGVQAQGEGQPSRLHLSTTNIPERYSQGYLQVTNGTLTPGSSTESFMRRYGIPPAAIEAINPITNEDVPPGGIPTRHGTGSRYHQYAHHDTFRGIQHADRLVNARDNSSVPEAVVEGDTSSVELQAEGDENGRPQLRRPLHSGRRPPLRRTHEDAHRQGRVFQEADLPESLRAGHFAVADQPASPLSPREERELHISAHDRSSQQNSYFPSMSRSPPNFSRRDLPAHPDQHFEDTATDTPQSLSHRRSSNFPSDVPNVYLPYDLRTQRNASAEMLSLPGHYDLSPRSPRDSLLTSSTDSTSTRSAKYKLQEIRQAVHEQQNRLSGSTDSSSARSVLNVVSEILSLPGHHGRAWSSSMESNYSDGHLISLSSTISTTTFTSSPHISSLLSSPTSSPRTSSLLSIATSSSERTSSLLSIATDSTCTRSFRLHVLECMAEYQLRRQHRNSSPLNDTLLFRQAVALFTSPSGATGVRERTPRDVLRKRGKRVDLREEITQRCSWGERAEGVLSMAIEPVLGDGRLGIEWGEA